MHIPFILFALWTKFAEVRLVKCSFYVDEFALIQCTLLCMQGVGGMHILDWMKKQNKKESRENKCEILFYLTKVALGIMLEDPILVRNES